MLNASGDCGESCAEFRDPTAVLGHRLAPPCPYGALEQREGVSGHIAGDGFRGWISDHQRWSPELVGRSLRLGKSGDFDALSPRDPAGSSALAPHNQRRADRASLDVIGDLSEQRDRCLPTDGGQERAGVGSNRRGDTAPGVAIAPQAASDGNNVDSRGYAGAAAVVDCRACRVDHERDRLCERIWIVRCRDGHADDDRRLIRRHATTVPGETTSGGAPRHLDQRLDSARLLRTSAVRPAPDLINAVRDKTGWISR